MIIEYKKDNKNLKSVWTIRLDKNNKIINLKINKLYIIKK
jgi:hypothetical protein